MCYILNKLVSFLTFRYNYYMAGKSFLKNTCQLHGSRTLGNLAECSIWVHEKFSPTKGSELQCGNANELVIFLRNIKNFSQKKLVFYEKLGNREMVANVFQNAYKLVKFLKYAFCRPKLWFFE